MLLISFRHSGQLPSATPHCVKTQVRVKVTDRERLTVDGGQLAERLMHLYEVRPRKDRRGVDLISDVLPYGRLLYGEPNAIDYAQFYSRAQSAVDSRL